MLKVAVVGTVGIPACYGGFESLVENITSHSSNDINYEVFCSSKAYRNTLAEHNGAKLTYLPLNANGISSIFYDALSIIISCFKKKDVILILGVSGCITLPLVRVLSKTKIITNIDGLEWRREKWNPIARKFLKISERLAVKYSHNVITDNQAIGDYVSDEYGVSSHVIAYGGDHAISPFADKKWVQKDYYLTICRIEPENNLSMILAAFARSIEKIKVIGNWQSNPYGRDLREKYSNFANIEMIDPVYDSEQLYIYRSECKGYVHGHSAGGTNPSLVEAMHFGKPVYAFDCDFNKYTTEHNALYFSNSEELLFLINSSDVAYSLDVISNNMKQTAEKMYTWAIVNQAYEGVFRK